MAAKSTLQLEVAKFLIPISNVLSNFTQTLFGKYFWTSLDRNILYSSQNKVNKSYNFSLYRLDEVIISRIRIGHSTFTHSYLLQGNNSRNAFFATTHLLYKTFFQSFQTHAFPARNSSRQCLISLQCLMYMYFYSFCKNAIITTKFKVLFVYIFYSNLIFINFYVRRMRR